MEQEASSSHTFYEQFGAPVVLHRNAAAYTQQNESEEQFADSALTKQFLQNETELRRAMARWYYPPELPFRPDDERTGNKTLMEVYNSLYGGNDNMKLFAQHRKGAFENDSSDDSDNSTSDSSSSPPQPSFDGKSNSGASGKAAEDKQKKKPKKPSIASTSKREQEARTGKRREEEQKMKSRGSNRNDSNQTTKGATNTCNDKKRKTRTKTRGKAIQEIISSSSSSSSFYSDVPVSRKKAGPKRRNDGAAKNNKECEVPSSSSESDSVVSGPSPSATRKTAISKKTRKRDFATTRKRQQHISSSSDTESEVSGSVKKLSEEVGKSNKTSGLPKKKGGASNKRTQLEASCSSSESEYSESFPPVKKKVGKTRSKDVTSRTKTSSAATAKRRFKGTATSLSIRHQNKLKGKVVPRENQMSKESIKSRRTGINARYKRENEFSDSLLQEGVDVSTINPEVQFDRAEMLLAGQPQDHEAIQLAKKKLLIMSQFDANHVPTLVMGKGDKGELNFGATYSHQNSMYTTERFTRGDPAYLAPFPSKLIQKMAKEEDWGRHKFTHTKLYTMQGPQSPKAFGNCLLSFPCKCGYCSESSEIPTPCVLHPVGLKLEKLRLSFCWLPRNHKVDWCKFEPLRKLRFGQHVDENSQIDFDMGDQILEIRKSGADDLVFIVRTSCHLTMVKIEYHCRGTKVKNQKCWSLAYIELLHRWDHRTLSTGALSFLPVTVSEHPRFGKYSPSNIVSVYKASSGRQNYIHHIHASRAGQKVEQHVVRNLCEMTHLEFSAAHPMVLWSAARSFVHPLLYIKEAKTVPRVGYGTALFSVDLRCSEKATFQWSPSAEDYFPEGILSISGLSTDWSSDHRIWISSISAARTWEIDSRMPCRAVTAYTLPHHADVQSAIQAVQEVTGSGSIFSHPWNASPRKLEVTEAPVLCVGKSPRTFGIHLYQRLTRNQYHVEATECFDGPTSSCMHDLSIARSSIYPLPDRSDRTFPIGLTSFALDLDYLMDEGEIRALDSSRGNFRDMICALSLTSKGDIHLHSLLSNKSSRRRGAHHPGLPGGSSTVAVPEDTQSMHPPKYFSWNGLPFHFSNDMPAPGDALDFTTAHDKENVVDLNKKKRRISKKTVALQEDHSDEEFSDHYLYIDKARGKVNEFGNLGKYGWHGRPYIALRALHPELFVAQEFLDGRLSQREQGSLDDVIERSDLNGTVFANAWPEDNPAWTANDDSKGGDETSDEDGEAEGDEEDLSEQEYYDGID